jgi:hypothetical protein
MYGECSTGDSGSTPGYTFEKVYYPWLGLTSFDVLSIIVVVLGVVE